MDFKTPKKKKVFKKLDMYMSISAFKIRFVLLKNHYKIFKI